MEDMIRAIEATGTIDDEGRLRLDEPLPINAPQRVRVLILFHDEPEISETEWLRGAASNPVFGFLKEAKEDIYTLADGKPFEG